MKPKTRLQVEVWRLHQGLLDPVEHEKFVISKHDFYYTPHYKNLVCLECNHAWKPPLQFWAEELIGVKCPSCNRKLKKIEYKNGATRILSYSVVQVVERFQVIRYLSCWKTMSKSKKPEYHFRSLFEEWAEYDKNKKVIIGRNTTWTGDGFNSSDYEIRQNTARGWRSSAFDSFASNINCPGAKFLPRFAKYGLKEDFHNCDYRFLLKRLEDDPKVETLLKAKQKELLFNAVHKNGSFHSYWPQIKMVIRHKYKITDAGMWYDYLQLLQEYRKDINNPTIILPKNLKKAHDDLMSKKQKQIAIKKAIQDQERQERERVKAEAAEALKNVKSELFKNFLIQNGQMRIVPLIEEEDVKAEGKLLKHCVHTNSYHKKSGILLMSARIGDKRIETIEISLASFSIIQSRGLGNVSTEYHNEIVNLVKKNMGKISKLVAKATDFRKLDSTLNKLEQVA